MQGDASKSTRDIRLHGFFHICFVDIIISAVCPIERLVHGPFHDGHNVHGKVPLHGRRQLPRGQRFAMRNGAVCKYVLEQLLALLCAWCDQVQGLEEELCVEKKRMEGFFLFTGR